MFLWIIIYKEKESFEKVAERVLKVEEREKLKHDKINTIALAYCLPEIKSKYSLVANIKYLLKVQYKKVYRRYNLTKNIESEYDYLINGLIEGTDSLIFHFY